MARIPNITTGKIQLLMVVNQQGRTEQYFTSDTYDNENFVPRNAEGVHYLSQWDVPVVIDLLKQVNTQLDTKEPIVQQGKLIIQCINDLAIRGIFITFYVLTGRNEKLRKLIIQEPPKLTPDQVLDKFDEWYGTTRESLQRALKNGRISIGYDLWFNEYLSYTTKFFSNIPDSTQGLVSTDSDTDDGINLYEYEIPF